MKNKKGKRQGRSRIWNDKEEMVKISQGGGKYRRRNEKKSYLEEVLRGGRKIRKLCWKKKEAENFKLCTTEEENIRNVGDEEKSNKNIKLRRPKGKAMWERQGKNIMKIWKNSGMKEKVYGRIAARMNKKTVTVNINDKTAAANERNHIKI